MLIIILFIVATIWLIFWLFGRKRFPVEYGMSFNQNHAESLGLDWKETYSVMLKELNPKYVRIAAMWNQVEKEENVWDFSDVDFMMDEAEKYDAKVLLVVGQKAPRWPECHVPEWVNEKTREESKTHLLLYVDRVVNTYRDHPALELWQVENEAFINFKFGDCARFDERAVYDELERVRKQDPNHRIVMTDSGELSTWRTPSKLSDIFGTTLYRIVQNKYGWTFTYDWLPAGFYRLKAMLWGVEYQNFFVAELQAEPWFTHSSPLEATIEEQEKTMNPERLQKHIEYAERVGASRVYLWGVEWWYFMRKVNGDARYWEIVRDVVKSNI